MDDDHVTIDPEFIAQPGNQGRFRRGPGILGLFAMIGAAVIAVGVLWPPGDSTGDEAPPAETESVADEPEAPTEWVLEEEPAPAPLVAPSRSPSELLPGFGHEILLLATPSEAIEVVRLHPALSEASTTLLLHRTTEDPELSPEMSVRYPIGIDASGKWYAEIWGNGLLVVHDADRFWPDRSEVVAVRVQDAMWHSASPGQLVWVECSRDDESASLITVDLDADGARPFEMADLGSGCGAPRVEFWGTAGVLVRKGTLERYSFVRANGDRVPMEEHLDLLAESPDGLTLWALRDPDLEMKAQLRGQDGATLDVPGLEPFDVPVAARWSPDGSRLALWIAVPALGGDSEILRIVDWQTGEVVREVEDARLVYVDGAVAWTSDGHFLVYQRSLGDGDAFELAMVDVRTGATASLPLRDIVDEVRLVPADR